jgi:hypothetical protein
MDAWELIGENTEEIKVMNLAKELEEKSNKKKQAIELEKKELEEITNQKKQEYYLKADKFLRINEWPEIVKNMEHAVEQGKYYYVYSPRVVWDFNWASFTIKLNKSEINDIIMKIATEYGFNCRTTSTDTLTIKWCSQVDTYNVGDEVILKDISHEVCGTDYKYYLNNNCGSNKEIFSKCGITDETSYIEKIVGYKSIYGIFPCVKTIEDLNLVINALKNEPDV